MWLSQNVTLPTSSHKHPESKLGGKWADQKSYREERSKFEWFKGTSIVDHPEKEHNSEIQSNSRGKKQLKVTKSALWQLGIKRRWEFRSCKTKENQSWNPSFASLTLWKQKPSKEKDGPVPRSTSVCEELSKSPTPTKWTKAQKRRRKKNHIQCTSIHWHLLTGTKTEKTKLRIKYTK